MSRVVAWWRWLTMTCPECGSWMNFRDVGNDGYVHLAFCYHCWRETKLEWR